MFLIVFCTWQRWKESLAPVQNVEYENPKPQPKKRIKKYWSRPVKCVETGQVFPSIKICSNYFGLSHKSIWNSINSGNARNGLHFVNVDKEKADEWRGDVKKKCPYIVVIQRYEQYVGWENENTTNNYILVVANARLQIIGGLLNSLSPLMTN